MQEKRSTKPTRTNSDSAQSESEPLNFEIGRAVDYLLAKRLDVVRDLLKNAELPSSGNRATLEKRVLKALADDHISPQQIIDHLDQLEGWGNQHIALFRSTEALAESWQDRKHVRGRLEQANLGSLLNRQRPIGLPNKPTMGQILWNSQRVQFVWVDESTWHTPLPDKNYDEEGIHYKAFEIKQRRGVCYFDWDLVTCEAALLMHEMPTNCYSQLQRQLLGELAAALEVVAFETISLVNLIGELERSAEVTRRNLNFVSPAQTKIDFRSRSKYDDAFLDPIAKKARTAMGTSVVGDRGHFYWGISKELQEPLPMRVYPRENRFSIHRHCTEDEVRHVMARVRNYCG